jgi:hypothetical protein
MSSGQISDQNKLSHLLWHLKPFIQFGARYGPTVLGAAPRSLLQLRWPLTPPQTLKVPKLAHLRFQQLSDQITISSCSGTLNRSPAAVRGWIWPHRVGCSPSLVFATPFAHHAIQTHKIPKLAHLRFQQISDQITIRGGCNSERRSGTSTAGVNWSPNRRG